MKPKLSDLLVPTERAQIHWLAVNGVNDRPAVVVHWWPEPGAPEDCPGWNAIRRLWLEESRMCSDGACWADWTRNGRSEHDAHCSPEHIFACILSGCHHPDPAHRWRILQGVHNM